MATPAANLKISKATSAAFVAYLGKLLDYSKSRNQFRSKMDMVDEAYARFRTAQAQNDQSGVDTYGKVHCNAGDIQITNPVVISQVESMVAYWAEVFLSGYPIFPVVSSVERRKEAESLEGMVQDHLILSESIPELQLMLQDAAKYNVWGLEVDWAPVKTYEPYLDLADFTGQASTGSKEKVTKINFIRRMNLRNTHWDTRVPTHKVDSEGEYVGYTKVLTRMGLKDLLNFLTNDGSLSYVAAVNQAMQSTFAYDDYREDPVISNWPDTARRRTQTDWDAFGGWVPKDVGSEAISKVPNNNSGTYLLHTFYLRLVPSDFGLNVPNKNSVQVWKIRMVNRDTIISCEPYVGSMGRFGIFLGPAIEDGMDLQTQSYAEMAQPIQDATTRLFNIRFQAAKRAISDRGLYNPDLIRPSDINSPIPSAKIPVKANQLTENMFQNAYQPIPFNYQGTEGVLQDAMLIQEMQKDLSGMNNATRGQFQKGNKTMQEFNTIMGNAENRMRLPALVLEYRGFTKVKEQLKLNILQFAENTTVISPRNGRPLDIDVAELQKTLLQFELADGYTPKSKMANTDFMVTIVQLIMNSPQLQQAFGMQLPSMIAHLAQLGGVRGMDQYAQAATEQWQQSLTLQAQIQQMAMQIQQMVAQQTQQPQEGQQGQQPQQGAQ